MMRSIKTISAVLLVAYMGIANAINATMPVISTEPFNEKGRFTIDFGAPNTSGIVWEINVYGNSSYYYWLSDMSPDDFPGIQQYFDQQPTTSITSLVGSAGQAIGLVFHNRDQFIYGACYLTADDPSYFQVVSAVLSMNTGTIISGTHSRFSGYPDDAGKCENIVVDHKKSTKNLITRVPDAITSLYDVADFFFNDRGEPYYTEFAASFHSTSNANLHVLTIPATDMQSEKILVYVYGNSMPYGGNSFGYCIKDSNEPDYPVFEALALNPSDTRLFHFISVNNHCDSVSVLKINSGEYQ